MIEARRPDIILFDKKEQKGIIINIAVLGDERVRGKEKEKVEKYQGLRSEIIGRLWGLKMADVLPAVIGVLNKA